MRYAPNVRVVRLMCSGRVDPQFVLDAFAKGADGVLIGGCHPGDCHYQEGNYKTLRRVHLLKRVLKEMGIEEDRFRLEWISAAEADRLRARDQRHGGESAGAWSVAPVRAKEVFAEEVGLMAET